MSAFYRQWHSLPIMQAGDMYKFPRTMAEAYPTHDSHEVHEVYAPMSRIDRVVTVICSVIGLGILAALALGAI